MRLRERKEELEKARRSSSASCFYSSLFLLLLLLLLPQTRAGQGQESSERDIGRGRGYYYYIVTTKFTDLFTRNTWKIALLLKIVHTKMITVTPGGQRQSTHQAQDPGAGHQYHGQSCPGGSSSPYLVTSWPPDLPLILALPPSPLRWTTSPQSRSWQTPGTGLSGFLPLSSSSWR